MTDVAALRALLHCLDGRPRQDTDWSSVIAAANHTLTTGTLAQALWSHGVAPPDDVRELLTDALNRVERRNMMLREQLEHAAAWLDRSGIRPIVLKGAAALLGEPSAHGRMLSDFDIMVPERQMAAAIRCLERIGYAATDTDAFPPNPVRLARNNDAAAINLHAQLSAGWLQYDYRRLRTLCVARTVHGGKIWLPAPTAQAFVLIMHDQLQDRDYWRGLIDLRHLLDLKALASSPEGIDWRALSEMFPDGFPKRALTTQLRTLRELTATPVPQEQLGGWLPWLQHRRRLFQLNWPRTAPALTMASLAIDPPLRLRGIDRAEAPPLPGGSGVMPRLRRDKVIGKV